MSCHCAEQCNSTEVYCSADYLVSECSALFVLKKVEKVSSVSRVSPACSGHEEIL